MTAPTRTCISCKTPIPGGASYCPGCGEATPTEISRETGETHTPRTSEATETEYRQRLERALGEGYDLRELIGKGGFGAVYTLWDVKLEREVAVKALRHDLFPTPELLERFQREARAVAKLRHPNVLPVHFVGEGEGIAFMVMPKVDGESLRVLLDREGRLSVEESARITTEAAFALQVAHDAGIIHRDVKPENILLEGKERRVLLMDFGIAKVADNTSVALTGTGMLVGTPLYMSPEQATGEREIDSRSDIYALGCVLYEMLEGSPPFFGNTLQALIAEKIIGVVPEFSGDTSLPATLPAVVRKALAASPDSRYPTPAALAEDLETALTAEAIQAATTRRRRTRQLRVLGATVGVVLLGFGGLWITTLLGGPSIERVALLPFANDRNDPTQEFFIEGMHDALIAEMGQAGIEVIGRRSVMRYSDDVTTPVREISRELNADAVIEGFAFRDGDSVGIRVSLVDGTTETTLWSGSFGTEARNVIRLYRQVAGAIAREIDLTLSPEVAARLASTPAVDPAAYEAYLNGMYHWYRLTRQDLDLAEQYFELALEIDPDYALAHKGMAALWSGRQQFGFASPAEAGPKGRAAAQLALEADSTIAEVHLTLAVTRTWTDWDWQAAEESFRRALEINPNYAEAHAYYSHLLVFLARPEEAIEQADIAVVMDPLNSLIGALSCIVLVHVGRHEEAVERCEETLGMDPTQPVALRGLNAALWSLGRHDEFLANRIAMARARGDEEQAQVLEQGYAEGGFDRAMGLAAELLVARSEAEFVQPTTVADAFNWAGEPEKVLDWLESGLLIHDPDLPYAVGIGWPEEVLNHPRFWEIRRQMGLPERD